MTDTTSDRVDGAAGTFFDVRKKASDRGATEEERESRRRTITSVVEPRDHQLPVPNGWFAALSSHELAPLDLVSFQAVGRDLVVYRDEHGAAHVLDAYCRHLGAHLGGGQVLGDCVECPFHGWQYDPDGQCVEIPYNESRIPEKARVRSYPVVERNGMIWFWYHAGDAEPSYEVPVFEEVDDPEWSDAHTWGTDLTAALQEMAENNVDYAHFQFVHRSGRIPLTSSEFTPDGHSSLVVETMGDGLVFKRWLYGPGVGLLRMPGVMTIIAATTPIDRGTCRLIWHFHFPASMAEAGPDLIETVTGRWGLMADVPIWRDKTYWEQPLLVKGDGAIAEFRRWYSQFYEGND